MYPMNSNYSKRSGQKRLNHTVQLHHIKLTSSMPFMNPFGSFSISMFGFLFILKRRSFSDQESTTSANTLHLPYDRSFSLPARLASLATRPMFQDDSWLYLEITRGLRVRSLMSRGLRYRKNCCVGVIFVLSLFLQVGVAAHRIFHSRVFCLFDIVLALTVG